MKTKREGPFVFRDVPGPITVRGCTEILDSKGILMAEVITIEAGFQRMLESLGKTKRKGLTR